MEPWTIPPRSGTPKTALFAAGLVLLTWVSFQGVLSNGFVGFDDDRYVTENPHVLAGLDPDSIAWAFTTTAQANWHPWTWLSHMLDVQLFGLDAGAHHRTSLALHVLNVLLLFGLLDRMTGSAARAAFCAALFAIHPLHVESVAWIAERKDVLSTCLWLLTLAAWLAFLRTRARGRYVGALVLYACALMAKPMPVTLPFTLLLLDLWPLRRIASPLRGQAAVIRGLLLEKAPLFFLSAVSCVVTFVVQRSGGAVEPLELLPVGERVANAIAAYAAYLAKTFRPVPLAVFYPHPHIGLLDPRVLAAAAVLAAISIVVARVAARAPYALVGWLWYLGTLVPVAGLVQVGGQAMADRYTYVPLIGIFVVAAWALPASRTSAALASAALAACLLATRARVPDWSTSVAVFRHDVAVTKDNWLAENNLGLALFDAGRAAESIPHYQEALRIRPGYRRAIANLALALTTTGDDRGAVEQYAAALSIDPGDPVLHFQMAGVLARAGDPGDAATHYVEALRLDPEYADAHTNLGNLLAGFGRIDEAVAHYEEALRRKPQDAVVRYDLGSALLTAARPQEGIAQLREAVRLRPGFAEAHNALGVAFLRLGDMPAAIACFEEALRLRPDLTGARRNLEEARSGR